MRPILEYTRVVATSFVPEPQDPLKFEETPEPRWNKWFGTPVGHAGKGPLLSFAYKRGNVGEHFV